jgi:hypothetical protein
MQPTEVSRIAKELNMTEADVSRLSGAIDYARLGKLFDEQSKKHFSTPLDAQVAARMEECPESDEVYDEGY